MRRSFHGTLTNAFLFTSTALAGLTLTAAAQAQNTDQATSTATKSEESGADTIVVIGTRRLDRTLTNSPSPVDVIGTTELTTQPAADMLDVVKNIVPSFFVAQNTIGDASTFVRSPSLRGLPADEILVMINGKRFNRSALVQTAPYGLSALSLGSQGSDLSLIPTIAINNLQVLREGATAQYGSDAIAGVLNYGLKTKPGLELVGRFGQHYDHGDGDSRQIAGNLGFKVGDAGFINFSGEYNDDLGTVRNRTNPNAVLFAQANPGLASLMPNYPKPPELVGTSPNRGYKLMLNSGFDIAPDAQLYFIGNIAHSKADQSFNYRATQTFTAVDSLGVMQTLSARSIFAHPVYLTPCPVGNASCPGGGFVKDSNIYNLTSLYPAGFTPRFIGLKDQAYGVVGVKGEVMGLTYDASASLSRNSLDLSMYSSINASYGPQSQTEFEFGKFIQKEFNANLDLTYALDAGLASPITIAGGFEYRRESYTTTAGDLQSYSAGPYANQDLYLSVSPGVYAYDSTVGMPPGASGYAGTNPDAAGTHRQSSYGFYLSAEADITDKLTVGVAGRYEHYSSFGSAKVGKVNAIWKAMPGLSVRGTVGTGFHAPSPGQSSIEVVTTTFAAGGQVQVGTYPVSSPIAQYYGAVPLQPEKSTNFGLGFVINPIRNFTVTVDGYSIKVRDRISITSLFDVTAADVAALPTLALVGAGGAVQYFTNGFDTRTQGVDVVATYRASVMDHPLNLTLAYNYNKSKVTDYSPVAISSARINDISNYAPKHRANFSANWSLGAFSISARENFYSSWTLEGDYPGDHFGSEFTTDIDLSYAFDEHYTLSIGANNLFNNYPDKLTSTAVSPIFPLTGSTAYGEVYPGTGGPFGLNGGFWYARVRIKY